MRMSEAERIFAGHGFKKISGADGNKHIYEKWGYRVTISPMQTEILNFGHKMVIDNFIIRAAARQIDEIFKKEE